MRKSNGVLPCRHPGLPHALPHGCSPLKTLCFRVSRGIPALHVETGIPAAAMRDFGVPIRPAAS